MKKYFQLHKLLMLTIMTVLVLSFTGCSSNNQTEPATENTEEQNPPATEQTEPAENSSIILATTTSTQDSGLLDVLIPMFEEQAGYMVKTIAVGTGKALEMGENGEADVLLVHAPESEQPLVDSGVATNYQLVMHNDFIVVGPKEDPAGIKGAATTADALKKIADSGSIFVSRGDDSGTHKKELALWKKAAVEPAGQWYQETGQGMGATLKVASEKAGYTITDRATYLSQKDELALDIMLEGEESLLNIYHVMQVNQEKFPKVNADGAKAFVDFMVAPDTQKTIGEFGVAEYGEPLFFPDANK